MRSRFDIPSLYPELERRDGDFGQNEFEESDCAEEEEDFEDESAGDGEDDEETEEEGREAYRWWNTVPDYLKPRYELDIPAFRLDEARAIINYIGGPKHCPEAECRRRHRCVGVGGPPCFRADPKELRRVMLDLHFHVVHGLSVAVIRAEMDARGSRYKRPLDVQEVLAGRAQAPRRASRRRRRNPRKALPG